MKYRGIQVIATGQWLNALFTVGGEFSDAGDSIRSDMAAALGVAETDLLVVDSDTNPISGTTLTLPIGPGGPDLTYENFESRFTSVELDDITNFVYGVDTTTGNLLRPTLARAHTRAVARNEVKLTSALVVSFMDTLVAGGVVTAARKTVILTP